MCQGGPHWSYSLFFGVSGWTTLVLQSVLWCVRVDHTGPTICGVSEWTTLFLQSVVCCVRVDHSGPTVSCLLCQGGLHWSYSLLFAVSGWTTVVLQSVVCCVLSGWTKLGPKQLTATMAFAAKILDDGELMELNPFYPGFDLLILDKASALENLKFIFSFFTRKKNAVCLVFCIVCVCTCLCMCVCRPGTCGGETWHQLWGQRVFCFY